MWPKVDLTGKSFYWLTVIWISNEKKWKNYVRRCKCKCWKEVLRTTSHLNEDVRHSCWCRWWVNHHQAWTHFHRKYTEARKRCNNPNVDSYKYYWGRWIKFQRDNFKEFKNDMYESYLEHIKKYWEKQTSLDRIDSNWNYCKENCRWVTREEQSLNRSNVSPIEYKWKKMSHAAFARELGIGRHQLSYQLNKWLSIEQIIFKFAQKPLL